MAQPYESDKAERLKRNAAALLQKIKPDAKYGDRVPPGQTVTDRFPILHEGAVPAYDMSTWDLRVTGAVREERRFSFAELESLPRVSVMRDIHCVTRWSKMDTVWEGILFRDFLRHLGIEPLPEAKHVMVYGDYDYETNVPLADLMGDDILLAFRYGGEPLTDKHGGPLRLVVPHLYFWKSAKWLRGFEFMTEDRPGFWERNGFHNEADPFREQRYSEEGFELPEDEWVHKDYD
ncbi:sulfite oxidase-like oxidoreductase [Paenibacillus pasadenensis]|uniref:sulfite oxidase-like oxidoreductase n=1 Tax=Paenibacillus TaxID=44249 RepID=UPI00040A5A59|nr:MULTISPECIES: sulfite oxidase-like oxidoreductase [Paenibacillus]QGG57951.1 molybdopterin-dependent oxidoreductase [Paenibacillus sp. B01]